MNSYLKTLLLVLLLSLTVVFVGCGPGVADDDDSADDDDDDDDSADDDDDDDDSADDDDDDSAADDDDSAGGDAQALEDCSAALLTTDAYVLQGLAIDGSGLDVTVGYSGSCTPNTWTLCWEGAFQESEPLQAALFLAFDGNDDPCDDEVTETLDFDLEALRQAWLDRGNEAPGTIVLSVADLQANPAATINMEL